MPSMHFDPHGTAYTQAGVGPAVLLVHGVGLNVGIWAQVVPLLAGNRRVILHDMLGHGSSPLPREGATIEDYALQASRLLDHLGVDRCSVVGFSMGAMVAQQMAIADAKRVRSIAAISGVYARSAAERAAIRKRWLEFAARGVEPFIPGAIERWLTAEFREAHPEVEAEIAAGLRANDLTGYLRSYEVFATADEGLALRVDEIRCPALVLTGEHDGGSTPQMARELAARIPGSELVIMPGLRHLLPIEAPTALVRHVAAFLDRIESCG